MWEPTRLLHGEGRCPWGHEGITPHDATRRPLDWLRVSRVLPRVGTIRALSIAVDESIHHTREDHDGTHETDEAHEADGTDETGHALVARRPGPTRHVGRPERPPLRLLRKPPPTGRLAGRKGDGLRHGRVRGQRRAATTGGRGRRPDLLQPERRGPALASQARELMNMLTPGGMTYGR